MAATGVALGVAVVLPKSAHAGSGLHISVAR